MGEGSPTQPPGRSARLTRSFSKRTHQTTQRSSLHERLAMAKALHMTLGGSNHEGWWDKGLLHEDGGESGWCA